MSHHNRIITRPTVHRVFQAFLFFRPVRKLRQLLMALFIPGFEATATRPGTRKEAEGLRGQLRMHHAHHQDPTVLKKGEVRSLQETVKYPRHEQPND